MDWDVVFLLSLSYNVAFYHLSLSTAMLSGMQAAAKTLLIHYYSDDYYYYYEYYYYYYYYYYHYN
jgi:hypothetical protein